MEMRRLSDVSRGGERKAVQDLGEKYDVLLRLREEQRTDHDAGRDHHPDRRELKDVSTRWPGALSEIDRLPMETLNERRDEIASMLAREVVSFDALPMWMRAWIAVHRGLRGALAVKVWLRGKRAVDDETRAGFAAALATLKNAEEAALWRDALDAIAAPPRGRLVDLVLQRAADELGSDAETLRRMLWPPHPPR